MKKLLHIIATPREDKSRTLQISDEFLATFSKKYPNVTIDVLNLAKEKLPSLGIEGVEGKYDLLSGKEISKKAKKAWEEITSIIERFLSADIYLISTPMWNFSIPYMLKQYIDLIVQPKYLFRYTKTGVEGLAKNKKMIIIATRGGEYSSKEMLPRDFQEPYLKTIFGFVGIDEVTFIKAEPMDMGSEIQKEKLDTAKEKAKKIADSI